MINSSVTSARDCRRHVYPFEFPSIALYLNSVPDDTRITPYSTTACCAEKFKRFLSCNGSFHLCVILCHPEVFEVTPGLLRYLLYGDLSPDSNFTRD